MKNVNKTDIGQLPIPDTVKVFLQEEGSTDDTNTEDTSTDDTSESDSETE